MDRTGMLVHYVLPSGPSKGEHRPALIVQDWGRGSDDHDAVNLQVFTDTGEAGNFNDHLPAMMWETSVPYDEAAEPGSWHFPEQ